MLSWCCIVSVDCCPRREGACSNIIFLRSLRDRTNAHTRLRITCHRNRGVYTSLSLSAVMSSSSSTSNSSSKSLGISTTCSLLLFPQSTEQLKRVCALASFEIVEDAPGILLFSINSPNACSALSKIAVMEAMLFPCQEVKVHVICFCPSRNRAVNLHDRESMLCPLLFYSNHPRAN